MSQFATIPPSAPKGLVANPAATSIALSWRASVTTSHPLVYRILYRKRLPVPWSLGPLTTATSETIWSLSPSTGYSICVEASNPMGTSVSNIIQVTTPSAGVAPGPALNLTTSNLSSSSMTVSWAAPATGTPPFSYQLQIKGPGQANFSNVGLAINQTSQNVTGLTPVSTYAFQVVTTNATGSSTSTQITSSTTAALANAPTNLALVGVPGQTSVQLSWSAPTIGSPPLTYTVSLATPSGSGTFVPFITTATILSLTVTGLTAGTSYDFEVAASNAAGTGPQSTALTNITTAGAPVAPSVPTGVTAVAQSPTSVAVAWNASVTGTPPVSYIVGYRVTPATLVAPSAPAGLVAGTTTQNDAQLTWTAPTTGTLPFTYNILRSPHGANTFALVGTTSVATFDATGLTAGTSYDFEVTATNAAGTGPASNVIQVTTSPAAAVPGAPVGVTVGSLTSSSAAVSWSPPTAGGTVGGVTGGYVVQFRRTGTTTFSSTSTIPVIYPGIGSFSAGGFIWAVNASNQITINGTWDGISNGVTLLTIISGTLWQDAPSGWYSSLPTNPPVYSGPTAAPPWSVRVTGLTASTSYDFRVQASNFVGTGAASSIVSAQTNATAAASFTVTNSGILDPNGNVFVSRGIAVGDFQLNSVTPAQIIAKFPRCNLIRLAVGIGVDAAAGGFNTPNVSFTTITNWINAALAAGLVVIVDDHQQSSGQPPYTSSALTKDLNYAKLVGQTFATAPGVWIQDMNEPGTLTGLASYHQQFYTAFRTFNPIGIVFHELGDYYHTGTVTDNPVPYQGQFNIGWDLHAYNNYTSTALGSGYLNQTAVNGLLNRAVTDTQAWTKCSNGTTSNSVKIACWWGEVGWIDYQGGNINVDSGGGNGTNIVVQAALTTNLLNIGLSSGMAAWLLNDGTVFGVNITGMLDNSFTSITAHGAMWNATA